MNNKGFSLIELLIAIVVFSMIAIISFTIVDNTFGLTKEKSYDIFEKSIITQVKNYVYECDNNLLECSNDYYWIKEENIEKTSFYLGVMKKYSYFSELDYINPITGEEVSNCMKITVIKDKLSTLEVKLNSERCNN